MDRSDPQPPPLITTGPTIIGIVFKDGVIFGTDARVIAGERERMCCIDSNVFCCVAGTFAGTEAIAGMFSEQLKQNVAINPGRESRITTVLTLLKSHVFGYEGNAALFLGGVDEFGPQLHIVHSHGSTDVFPHATLGSEYAIADDVLEQKFKLALDKDQGIKLVGQAIRYSCGSNADIFVITRDLEPEYLLNHFVPIPEMNVPPNTDAVARLQIGDLSQDGGQSQG